MKKAWNIIWKIALVCGVAGIVLTLVGLSRGWPQAVSWGSGRAQVVNSRDLDIDETPAAFTAIDVQASVLDVNIVSGDHYGLTVRWPNAYGNVTWSDDGGVLKVQETDPHLVMTWYNQGGTITVTVPDGTTLTTIDASSSTDNVSVSVPATTVTLNSSTGSVTLTAATDTATLTSSTGNVSVTANSKNLNASSSTGNVTVNGQFDQVNTSSSTGDVSLSGSLNWMVPVNGTASATTSTGNVSVHLTNGWAMTMYTLNTGTGRITASGPGAPDVRDAHHLTPPGATPGEMASLDASSSTGDVSVTLGG